MPARIPFSSIPSKKARSKKPFYVVALVAIVALAAWANHAWADSTSTTADSPITPALKLAAGTISLESTDQAVDSASAAKLLPLWQLLAQLQDSQTANPQEITCVIDEIKLNMTSAQIKAINAMSISDAELGVVVNNGGSVGGNSTQAASAGLDPSVGGGMPAGLPIDGGGPMPSGRSQSTSSSSSSSSSTAVPSVITKVIELLQSKVQS